MLQYLFGNSKSSSNLIRHVKHGRGVRTDEPCVYFKYYFEKQDFEMNIENKTDAEATADYYSEDNSFGSVLGGEWHRNNWFNNRTKEQANEYASHVLKDSIEYIKDRYPDRIFNSGNEFLLNMCMKLVRVIQRRGRIMGD